MSRFALALWVWEQTGQAAPMALAIFAFALPSILFSPISGALVDRWDKKWVMALSDIGNGLGIIVLYFLYQADGLQIWHIYAVSAVGGLFESFQWPAYSAAISTMLPQKHYERASGMMSLAEWGSQIIAPVLASVFYVSLGLGGLLAIDTITFVLALACLAVVHIPAAAVSVEGAASRGSLWQESLFGFRYIWARPSLLLIQLIFTTLNLTGAINTAVTRPRILTLTDDNGFILGLVESLASAGGVIGALALMFWGGPRPRIHGVLLSTFFASLCGGVVLGISDKPQVWAAALFLGAMSLPILNGSNQAIWQAKVPPDLQGRVFSVRRMIAQITFPLGLVVTGFSTDYIFEPAMQPGGALAGSFGWLVGTGPGAGMGLLLVVSGLIGMAAGIIGYGVPLILQAESLLPDHEGGPKADSILVEEALPNTEEVPILSAAGG
jgi:MFS family permease